MAEFSSKINQEMRGEGSRNTSYEVVSSIPGRIRLRIPFLPKNSTDQNKIKEAIAVLNGVTSVRLNPLANSVIITFNEAKISSIQLEQAVATMCSSIAKSQPSAPRTSPHTVINHKPDHEDKEAQEKVEEDWEHDQGEIKTENLVASVMNQGEINSSLPLVNEPLKTNLKISAVKMTDWPEQCQEQAEVIEKLQDRLAALRPIADIGSAWLKRWYRYSPSTINDEDLSWLPHFLLSPPDQDTQWPTYAAQQTQAIAHLEQCLIDCQRLATIGEARLNKYRKYP